ncbi:MAG TPA: prolyl oligopeptidase family serine peptidase [Armatimonadota bacterium]|nr:prolyl oligopeptidase family serine peptidase [Armatimonadota bacterium]
MRDLLDDICARYRVDPDRIYLTGLSMGGYGAWDMAIEFPDLFAAIAPLCGGGDPGAVAAIKHLPVWVFHGGKDPTVPLRSSEEMVQALQALGNPVQFTIYPEAGHDCWTETYNNPKLYEWFLQHRRGENVK